MNTSLKYKVLHHIRTTLKNTSKIQELALKVQDGDPNEDTQKYIRGFLANLKLLRNVPFHYLVPHAAMLPEESLKFFYLDTNWLNALVDGAYSIGRYAAKENNTTMPNEIVSFSQAVDAAFIDDMQVHSLAAARQHRDYMFKLHHDYKHISPKALRDTTPPVISGFLLRSSVVSDWDDLQANAYNVLDPSTSSQELDIFRLEQLADDILIGLFVGDFKQLDIHEPPQGVHFGFDKGTDGKLHKQLRSPDSKGEAGNVPTEDIAFRKGSKRVVDMASLSKAILSNLNQGAKPDYTDGATPALDHLLTSDFALQMVQGVGMVHFQRPTKSTS